MKIVGLIPVRLQSTRLPSKALKDVYGLPAIVHVYKRCCYSKKLDEVYVVTDSKEIQSVVEQHGGKVLLSGEHRNGSERIHEVAGLLNADIIINIQGDEILVYPQHIDAIIDSMLLDANIEYVMGATPYSKIGCKQDFKAIVDKHNNLLYCSREDIPSAAVTGKNDRLKMVFIVGFTPSSLTEFIAWGESSLELREPNEFLRILENGKKIKIVNIEKAKISLDTQEDLEEIRALMQIDSLVKSYM
jgi:3-deoxy-manno-octulosonate cytidylyltransferase (CMP-KDO synthetase)